MRPQHPRASREQRSLHTRGPSAPDARARRRHLRAPRRHLPLPDARARGDGARAANADPEAAPRRGRGPAPPPGDSRGAEQGRLRARGAPPAPPPPWGPGPASSPCGRWRRPGSRGPREARAPRGWRGRGLGRRGARGGGLRYSCTYPCLRRSLVPGVPPRGPTQSPASVPSGRVLGAQASLRRRPRTCRRARLRTRWGWGGTSQPPSTLSTPDLDSPVYF